MQGADFETFSKAAQKAEDVTYVQTKSADVAKAAALSAAGITVITNFEGKATQRRTPAWAAVHQAELQAHLRYLSPARAPPFHVRHPCRRAAQHEHTEG